MPKGKKFVGTSLAILLSAGMVVGVSVPIAISAQSGNCETSVSLGLDPKNDPVVFTTTSGLEIRKSDGQYSTTATYKNITGQLSGTQDLRGLYYFTMGTFPASSFYTGANASATVSVGAQAINWIILGRGSFPNVENNELLLGSSGDAGDAIKNDVQAELRKFFGDLSVVKNTEIPNDCILVISEKVLGQTYFNSGGAINYAYVANDGWSIPVGSGTYGNRYRFKASNTNGNSWGTTAGNLYTAVESMLSINASTKAIVSGKNKFGFTQAQANLIVPQQLTTVYHNRSSYVLETPSTDVTWHTMFPLAVSRSGYSQSFEMERYLNTQAKRLTTFIGTTQAVEWWARSSGPVNQGVFVYPHGAMSTHTVNATLGVRPAFVMKFEPSLI